MAHPLVIPQFVRIEHDCVLIQRGDKPSNTYDIGLERIPDYHALVQWVLHLCEKGWFDTTKCRQLIEIVCKHKGWTPYTPEH